ncbi:MAG TPA: outer membrane beta-barrel protein [Flavisolibacter sp.]|nr:outer membrane beta-barrel protein [Flavisolibacter sp.]
MRRIFLFVLATIAAGSVFAQTDSAARDRMISHKNMPRSGDHFMLQFGYLTWNGAPDSINTSGIPRTANVYFLFDFPFKTNPRWSAAIGAGVGTDHMYFDKTYVGIKDRTSTLVFDNVADTNSFKKYKLSTVYVEAPVELRFSSNPDNNKRSFKAAIGVKAGLLLSAGVKGKNLENKAGSEINDYTVKEKSKNFFNRQRLAATARLGYGNLSLFGSYQITTLFKEGVAAEIRPLSIGITLSGL